MEHIPATEITALSICDALGRREMATRLERTVAAVSNAASEGAFPPAWYLVISEMCQARGLECPPALFRFLQPAAPSDLSPSQPDEAA